VTEQQKLSGEGFDVPVYDCIEKAIAKYREFSAEIKRLIAARDCEDAEIRALMLEHSIKTYPTPIGSYEIQVVETEKLKFNPQVKRPA
jgi:hypothetical protein